MLSDLFEGVLIGAGLLLIFLLGALIAAGFGYLLVEKLFFFWRG